ncbi:ORF13 [Fowl aviadenovirus A]|uniref:ORF13 n=1 Tax=Fowl aviadenovirus A TaxID=190061 RepID=A0A286QWS9_9ADEN|nr:ORF13 [Fowl aviadenovirus A]
MTTTPCALSYARTKECSVPARGPPHAMLVTHHMTYNSLPQCTKRRRESQSSLSSEEEQIASCIPDTPSPCLFPSTSPMDHLVERLFVEGVAHEVQWNFPSKNLIPTYERERVLEALKERFGPGQSLINQLPSEEPDTLKAAFYNVCDNWFHQMMEAEGYEGKVAGNAILRWLRGELNTLVLCGGRLSNAKSLFNALCACFPLAISDSRINSILSLGEIAPHTSLYCLPFVDEKPDPLMLHCMEGNAATCRMNKKTFHIPSTPMLIHCADLSLANEFTARNTVVFFLTGDHTKTPPCYHPRKELRDFVANAAACACLMTLHCKRDNKLCNPCIRTPLQNQ